MATRLSLGQFSVSPVVLAAAHLGLDAAHGLDLVTTAVPSSPGQFSALRSGEIDVAITSPDNVLLYATTDRNPLGEQINVRMLRPIDRGLGLALLVRPEVGSAAELAQRRLAVDVVRSGFALLLFTMLADLGIDYRDVAFDELGSTPARGAALIEGRTSGTILNAETRVSAEADGMQVWRTSTDVSDRYLGTVLAVPPGIDDDVLRSLSAVWAAATDWLLHAPENDVRACLGEAGAALGTAAYLALLRDPRVGLLESDRVDVADLEVLVGIRRSCGAFTPDVDGLADLVHP